MTDYSRTELKHKMVDTEMQEQDVTFGAEDVLVETKYLEEEPLEPENHQNPSEIPQPLVLGDGQANNGHGINGGVGVVDHSERKTRKVQILSPKTEVENTRKRKTWLLDSEVNRLCFFRFGLKSLCFFCILMIEYHCFVVKIIVVIGHLLVHLSLQAQGIDEAGTPVEQVAFLREVEAFYKENFLEFKPPKFYGQPLNILK